MPDPGARRRDRLARREEAAILLPFFGIVLLMPPILNLFVTEAMPFGVSPILAYLFGVWLVLVAGAVLFSRSPPFRSGGLAEEEPDFGEDGRG